MRPLGAATVVLLASACSAPQPPQPAASTAAMDLRGLIVELPVGTPIVGTFDYGEVSASQNDSTLAVRWAPGPMVALEEVDAVAAAAIAGVASANAHVSAAGAPTPVNQGGARGWTVSLRGTDLHGQLTMLSCDRRQYTMLAIHRPGVDSLQRRALAHVRCTPEPSRAIGPAAFADVVPGWSRRSSEYGFLVLRDETGSVVTAGARPVPGPPSPDQETEAVASLLRARGSDAALGARTVENRSPASPRRAGSLYRVRIASTASTPRSSAPWPRAIS